MTRPIDVRKTVSETYARAVEQPQASGCCCAGPAPQGVAAALAGYSRVALAALPADAVQNSFGCGNPVALGEIREGETVLDLGSGAGVDAILAARAVGPAGRVLGVDMTPEMLIRARANAAAAGLANVEFREGRLEALPVDDDSVDAVTSNCVINLVPDKAAVFREIHRVLRPGGRLVVADIILDGELPPAIATDLLAWVGCIAGAIERSRYVALLEDAGLGRIAVLRDVDYLAATGTEDPPELRELLTAAGLTTADIAGVVHSVTFRAVKPSTGARAAR
jgi:SAM-dependent methyltransferase